MINRIILATVLTVFISYSALAPSVIGLWGVTNVSVGDQIITPVERWFQFVEDGTATGGNGWTKNTIGTWNYGEETDELVATNDMGIKDKYGAFKVTFAGDTMRWNRMEDDMPVVVTLIPIDDMPPAPADLVKGLWDLTSVQDKSGQEVADYDSSDQQYIFIRPDMRFRFRNADGEVANGFWHMDGHRPILTLINYDRSIENQVFDVTVERNSMMLKSRIEEGSTFHYSRIREFPE
ncbi:MAG: hypothetical protein AAGC88_09290 [Bacteroidota bacterium]